jgi:GntR family transcriptional regulator
MEWHVSAPDLPRYHRIYLQLRERIIEGNYLPGDRLPGEMELAERYGVSRITSKRALNELERAGLVSRERGRGTLVRGGAIQASSFDGTLESLAAANRAIGETAVRLLDFTGVPPPPAVRAALRTGEDESVWRIVRMRSFADGTPFCHVTAYVPHDIGRTFSPAALETTMLVDLIERTGAVVEHAEQTVGATIASHEMAGLLGIDPAAPLLRLTRTAHAAGHRPVEHIAALFRPDRYSISMRLSRRSGAAEDEHFHITA